MSHRFEAGTVAWAQDPTNEHDNRPVVVLSSERHPFGATDCTVMYVGSSGDKYTHPTPELHSQHLRGISFPQQTHLYSWTLYTIPPHAINDARNSGELTDAGVKLVKTALVALFEL